MSQDTAVTAVVVGAGLRGRFTYGRLALADPGRLRIVGEPERARLEGRVVEMAGFRRESGVGE